MHREYLKWFSPALNREMELLIHGHGGKPYLVFPTSMGKFYEFEDRGMVHAVEHKVASGQVQFFCIDSVDRESWYNKSAHPGYRVWRHIEYENYVRNEVLPLIRHRNWAPRIGVTGASFGAYHCANFAFRHPELVSDCVAMSGAYDIRQFLDGYYDQNVYFNCPTDFLPNLTDPEILGHLRRMRIILGAGDWDICLGETQRLSGILHSKAVPHWLDIWTGGRVHDWPLWRDMARKHY
ncbi:MAG: alpha/beta hydrolase-fold protein [Bryobacteraceae bacterium]|nr:alpha/beta hydrolase-fold protein [Bryobacteraceae bacterium]MDW8377952.1 alpha/beta hydrolase-fold protein [Bryobacterales bacterium]